MPSRLRVAHPGGSKLLVVREDTRPLTLPTLVSFIKSRVHELADVPNEDLNLSFVDGEDGIRVSILNSDDIERLWKNSETQQYCSVDVSRGPPSPPVRPSRKQNRGSIDSARRASYPPSSNHSLELNDSDSGVVLTSPTARSRGALVTFRLPPPSDDIDLRSPTRSSTTPVHVSNARDLLAHSESNDSLASDVLEFPYPPRTSSVNPAQAQSQPTPTHQQLRQPQPLPPPPEVDAPHPQRQIQKSATQPAIEPTPAPSVASISSSSSSISSNSISGGISGGAISSNSISGGISGGSRSIRSAGSATTGSTRGSSLLRFFQDFTLGAASNAPSFRIPHVETGFIRGAMPPADAQTEDDASLRRTTTFMDRFWITVDQRDTHVFPLDWCGEETSTWKEIMGPLGREGWTAARGWGYRQAQVDSNECWIRYVPRNSDPEFQKSQLQGSVGYVQMTIFYNSRLLFLIAKQNLPYYLPDLRAPTFSQSLVDTLRLTPTASSSQTRRGHPTEWSNITPPLTYRGPDGRGDLHVGYLVRLAGQAVTEGCARAVEEWIGRMMSRGDWVKAKHSAGFRVPRGYY
ncbi:hypothetical protein M427DRAFT_131227 [Gonapodya prolifera JEL478]|uniref:PB1 domain-containing protein n=1 Tax=Gonapodya prolifera (strain JEL478) TaxID=1344416 RepID=A0A139AUG1_GONPJ|nr:hypothetical protein M427DRAFT_131227 [Gonapodya prolifera JEL478]|eukprot:KXS20380.1 hypothetical protein M427DRAFT_131227 [Gonapodya prolifera JEL478]